MFGKPGGINIQNGSAEPFDRHARPGFTELVVPDQGIAGSGSPGTVLTGQELQSTFRQFPIGTSVRLKDPLQNPHSSECRLGGFKGELLNKVHHLLPLQGAEFDCSGPPESKVSIYQLLGQLSYPGGVWFVTGHPAAGQQQAGGNQQTNCDTAGAAEQGQTRSDQGSVSG